MTSPNDNALVSIVIPTKNRAGLLRETLDSVREQTYPHWEAIVVDDGSTDDTAEMMAGVCADEPRIRYMQRDGEGTGGSVCRNIGLHEAQGGYIIFLDSDDVLAPRCLEGRLHVLAEHPEADFVAFAGEIFRHKPGDLGILWNAFTICPDLYRFLQRRDNPWDTTGPMWRRETLRDRTWDEEALSSQDWEFHVRALLRGPKYVKVNTSDHYIRRNDQISDAVSKKAHSFDCFASRLRLTQRLAHDLMRFCPNDRRAKQTFTGTFVRDAMSGIPAFGNTRLVLETWNALRELGCITAIRHKEGCIYLRGMGIAWLRPLFDRLIHMRWLEYFKGSHTSLGRCVFTFNHPGVLVGEDTFGRDALNFPENM